MNRPFHYGAIVRIYKWTAALLFFTACQTVPYQHNEGMVFGTVYSITYQSTDDLQTEIEQTLQQVDNALSMFNPASVLTSVNNDATSVPDSPEGDMFCQVFTLARQVSDDTQGAFDITVAPLVNAWGFGFKQGIHPDSATIDSLCRLVGYEKVALVTHEQTRTVLKAQPGIMLDCSAVAKGFGVDAVATLLSHKGIVNYMVEIGGEVVTSGQNATSQNWRIGVSKPTDDTLSMGGELQTILSVGNAAMATSGNYRNFYYEGGRKHAHTIDPRTGHPVQHELLSATVLAPSCAQADAYATAFMVMGMEKAKNILDRHPELSAYFIFSTPDDRLGVWFSPSLAASIVNPQ